METFEEPFKMDAMLKPIKVGLIVLLVVESLFCIIARSMGN